MPSTWTVRSGSIRRVRNNLVIHFRGKVRERALSCGMPPAHFRDWVDEIVGEGIAVALSCLDQWNDERSGFLTWAYLKTRTLIRDELRKEKRYYRQHWRDPKGETASNLPDMAKRIEMKEQLLEIFSSLTEDQSEALIFYYLLGYSVKEIASVTGKPDATIYTLLRRGRERLQDERAS